MRADLYRSRRAVLACFRPEPQCERFIADIQRNADHGALLKWLDDSGLALYLVRKLTQPPLLERIPPALRFALETRVEANRQRTSVMLDELARVNATLQHNSVAYAILKGFTLTPEFCPEPWLRHQSDIDLLVEPASIDAAKRALDAIGYKVESVEPTGEICLAIRSDHIPSAADFLYGTPHHQHAEIHPAFWEPSCGVSFQVGGDWREHIEWRKIGTVRYPALDITYRFIAQLLHVFRHITSWARLSWLYEIAYFVETFSDDEGLWIDMDKLTNKDPRVRNACGVVCRMASEAFGTKLPEIIQAKWVDPLPLRQRSWIEHHAAGWMLDDFASGNKVGLILQREFADSRSAWWRFRWARLTRFVKGLTLTERAGPKLLAERSRKQVNYLWRTLQWNIEQLRPSARPKAARKS
jgi:hypothetical protein